MSAESLPERSYQGSGRSSPGMPKKRRRSASFAQANFRAQARENQPLPASPLTSLNATELRSSLLQETKHILIKRDNWPDDPVTEAHALRLTEAMIRLGVDNLDNLVTEASRINCGNMTITASVSSIQPNYLLILNVQIKATLLSAVVVTLFSGTMADNSTRGRQAANALFATSLFLSLSTGIASFLAMEWLAWSSSQELRAESVLYRMMRTAVRSGLMHAATFCFFTGLLVLLWEVTPPAVYVMPTIISVCFGLYYAAATLRPIYLTGWQGIGQFDSVDARGLRVQVWTPFSVGAQRLANYSWATIIGPVGRSIRRLAGMTNNRESTVSKPSPRIHKKVVHFERYEKAQDIDLEAQVDNSGRSTI